MNQVNWCKKCKAEVPMGESCPYCGGKLTKSGERLSFGGDREPVRSWFAWNGVLRIIVPVLAIVLITTLLLEALLDGAAGVLMILRQGFFGTLLAILAALLLLTWVMLALQGRESVHYVLDAKGAHSYTYLRQASKLRLRARLLSPATVRSLDAKEQAIDGLTFIHGVDLPWTEVRRIRFWPEMHAILLYRPRFYQALAICCDESDYDDAEAFARKKLSRNRKALPKKK